MKREKSQALWDRASQVMPLGVNSNFRYWGDDATPYVQKAQGAYLWDVDGNLGIDKPADQRVWAKGDKDYYLRLMAALHERGVMPDYDPREPWFLCYSHSDADIDATLNAAEDAVWEMKR